MSLCNGRLGNQLGVLAFGLAVNLQFGIKLFLRFPQWRLITQAFEIEKLCKNDGSTFCMALPNSKLITRLLKLGRSHECSGCLLRLFNVFRNIFIIFTKQLNFFLNDKKTGLI